MRPSAAVLPIFLALATAKGHKECACHSYNEKQGWHYDWELTKWTCYHDFMGVCIARRRNWIGGDRFEQDCIQNGVRDGYRRFNPDGTVDLHDAPIKVGGAHSQCQHPT
ncbi:hypothetical protein E4U42_002873 [Claviceps africana]|uniref:Uncharacterized protein n=1 Tax=Claviceps africana TaxID=83212 RepID=A0A8K0JCH4_9HYPO|nr:hypothetical protein E4U42_002873 [Claviceps africana]